MRTDDPSGISRTATHRAGMVFLAQRLEELTSPRSLDSYKAYTVNVPTLIEEAVEQLEAIRDGGPGISPSSATCITDELVSRVSGNSVTSAIVPSSRALTLRLGTLNPEKLLPVLKMLKQEISGWAYATQAMHLISDSINDKNKLKLSFLANELVSTLVNLGMSRRHINESVVEYFWSGTGSVTESDDLKKFFRDIFPHYHDFTVYFKIRSPLTTLENEKFPSLKVRFLNELPSSVRENLDDDDVLISKDCHFVEVIKIQALDRYSAIDDARKRVNLVHNLIRMYNHEIDFRINEAVIIEQCCSDKIKIVRPELYSRRPVTDTTKPAATTRLKTMISNSRFLRGKHYEKFVSVCEFHGHSMESSSIENKLLNLWISLETIAPSKRGNSKIDNVIEGCLPSLGLGYIKRIISALAHDMNVWDRAKLRSSLEAVSEDAPPNMKLLLLIAQQKYTPDLEKLFEIMDGQELLRNRVYTIHNSLCSSKSALSFIDDHIEKVDWQLRRIYRARNRIVHLGEVPRFVASLVDSAHDYFDQILTTVADISRGPNGFADFDASFSYLEWEYGAYRSEVAAVDYNSAESVAKLVWGRKKAVERYDVIEPVHQPRRIDEALQAKGSQN